MNNKILLAALSFLLINTCDVNNHPQGEITNGILKAHLYFPDDKNGYYKETRFDWSGVISSLDYNGHSYFGKWSDVISPKSYADIMGPVEVYSPLNYDEVNIGDEFIKIGVGAMEKTSNEIYSPFKAYKLLDSGTWDIKTKADEVQFVQTLNSENYSFEYTKTIRLVKNKPKMIISHSLKNTGKLVINTIGFNHNFFVIDNQPIGKDFEITFPVEVSGTGRGLGEIFEIQGRKIIFKRNIEGDETISCKYLEGITNNSGDFEIKIDNLHTGAGVKISGNHPLSRLRLWGTSTTLCPEPFIDIKVEPGEQFDWSYFYDFYISEIKDK